MVKMDSLEKTLKDMDFWVENNPDKTNWLMRDDVLEELGVVAQKIRDDLEDADLKSQQDDLDAIKFEWLLGYMRAKKEDLALLVEEGEK